MTGRQARLDWSPRADPRPLESPAQAKTRAELKRKKRSANSKAARVLARLEVGEASSVELVEIAGHRFGARIYDLRHGLFDGLFHDIREKPIPGVDLSTYRLGAVPLAEGDGD